MTRHVLMVEDSAWMANLVHEMVEKAKSELVIRTSGQDALFYLGKCMPDSLPVVIFLELNCPDMCGVTLLRQLKADGRYRRIPVCILAIAADEEDLAKAYESGVASVVKVPVSRAEARRVLKPVISYWLKSVQYPAVWAGDTDQQP